MTLKYSEYLLKLANIYKKKSDRDRTRTCNPQIRSLVPYPLGHTTQSDMLYGSLNYIHPIQ